MFNSTAIKALRLSLGQSSTQFADTVGVSVSTVSLWEGGHRHPKYAHLEKLTQIAEKANRKPREKVSA